VKSGEIPPKRILVGKRAFALVFNACLLVYVLRLQDTQKKYKKTLQK
jgi:hypothetical protein